MKTEEFPMYPVLEHYGFEVVEGHYGKIRCVFHGDRVASATWSEFYFKCFGCNAHGDAVRLIMERENLDWTDAYNRARELTGESSRDQKPTSTPQRRSRQTRRPFVPPRSGR
jgi:DNA primase